ncbi:MAG TPA: hypothetical protein VI248_22920, partial [Kineosporiaceae bacterium]
MADALAASAEQARARSGFAAAAEALQRAAELSPDVTIRARRLVEAGEAALQAGQPEWALDCVGRAEQAAGRGAIGGRVAAVRGNIQLRAGQLGQAVATLRDGAVLLSADDPTLAVEMLWTAAEAAGNTGDMGGLVTAAEQARTVPVAPSGAWLARCQGLTTSDPLKATKYLREALRLYDLGEERFGRARTELLLGEALRRAKRRTEA